MSFRSQILRAAPAALAALLAASAASAQETHAAAPPPRSPATVPTLRAARLAGDIRLDGRLDEPAWAAADSADAFTQSWPNPGAAPTFRTVARVLYGPTALYVGVRAYDPHPDSIAAPLARRDASSVYSDWIHLMVDSYHDRRTAWRFTVNPAGVKKDVAHSNNTTEDVAWDAVWEVGTAIDSAGWTAEFRIPYSQIRFSGGEPAGGRVWGFQVMRDVARSQERDSFAPWSQRSPGFVSEFGDLAGLVGVRPPRRLEVQPYASTRVTRAPDQPGNPFYHATEPRASAGVDMKYGLPLGMTLTATVNPDFGQVEVDPAVVNLTAFETFFPEKRPFFVEGADVFRFGQVATENPTYGFEQFFYSRRVGRQPQRAVLGDDVGFVDAPGETTILGAAKVSGKQGPWTAGLMDALTANESARYTSTLDGTVHRTAVEPLSNYFVGRLRRDLRGGGTVLGVMATASNRALGDTVFAPILRQSAYFGGVDFEHGWDDRNWLLTGYAAGTRVAGSREVMAATQASSARYFQRPDADYLRFDPSRTSLGGHIAEVVLRRAGTWYGSVDLKESSPGFEINDLGFQTRTDYRSAAGAVGYQQVNAGKRIRSWGGYAASNVAWNFGGDRIDESYSAGAQAQLNSLWGGSLNLLYAPAAYNDRLTRGGPVMRVPGAWYLIASAFSDQRKPVSASLYANLLGDASGGSSRTTSVSVVVRPSSSVRLTLGPSLDVQRSTGQYVTTQEDATATGTYGARYVFADLHQTTLSMETRVDWTFTPTLSLQLYAQPFVSAGNYSRFKELLRPRSYDFGVYGGGRGTLARDEAAHVYTADPDGTGPAEAFRFFDPDFNFRSLRGNAVVRWEYRPGSALYFVWQQERAGFDPTGSFRFGHDTGQIFREPATNVFLVKATYWLGR